MNMKSENITGAEGDPELPCWTLHIKKRGMNNVLATEIDKSRPPDHIKTLGNEQTWRPNKSARLNTKKWRAVNNNGCVYGLVGRIEVVMGGKTA